MNKKLIITGTGILLLTTGVIGGIWSGIDAMPALINTKQRLDSKYNEKEILYNNDMEINKINIDSLTSNITIKKHNKRGILIERDGNKELSNINIQVINNQLEIKEEDNPNFKETKSIDDIVKYFVDQIYTVNTSNITVYVPENSNIDLNTKGGHLAIVDDVVLDTLNIQTEYGYIGLNPDLKIKNLNINSQQEVSLSTNDISGIDNIKLLCGMVYISGNNYIEDNSKIPETVEIKTLNNGYSDEDVTIETNSPVAKNLIINSNNSVGINLPTSEYKFNFDVKSINNINFDILDESYNKYDENLVLKYLENGDGENTQRELTGVINESVKELSTEYTVNIKGKTVIFR